MAQNADAQPAIQGQGPMRVERIHDGWAFAPDFKVTEFDGGTHPLLGADRGWVMDTQLLVGGGWYWLLDPNHQRELSYGGATRRVEGADDACRRLQREGA